MEWSLVFVSLLLPLNKWWGSYLNGWIHFNHIAMHCDKSLIFTVTISIHWLTRDHWLLLLTSLSFLYFLLAKFFESIARGQWALMNASYFKPNKIETIWSRFAFLFLYFQHFFSCNCSTPLGIKRILFLLQQNRDSLVKVCYLCFACLFLYSVWTPLGIYFYFYWSKIETLGLWRTNLAAGEQNSLSSDCRLLVQKTNLPQMKPETWNDCHTLQNAPRWL